MRLALTMAFTLILSLFFPQQSHALGLAVSTGSLQMPNSGYHMLVFDTQTEFKISTDTQLMIQVGSTPPFSFHGFTEIVSYFSVNAQWQSQPTGFRFFGAAGLGLWADIVNGSFAPLGSLALNGGIKMGGEHLGGQLGMTTYLGISNISNVLSSSSLGWPIYNFLAGIYVGI